MQVTAQLLSQSEVKHLTDTLIHDYCTERSNEARKIDERYALLWDSVQKLLLAGGKRLRPYMVLLAYRSYAPTEAIEDIYSALVAQEILHSAMLIHDDIIDRDLIRYGVKNVAGQYEESYKPYVAKEEERSHFALSAAILSGDMLLSDAHRLMWDVKRPLSFVRHADEILSKGVFEVIGGELLDTEATVLPKGSISPEHIARYKTASYSFISPLTMGAVLAGADETELSLLTELSEALGIGYQLRDDLLGVFGDSAKTGKSTSSDIIEGKRTVLIEQFDILASAEQKERFYALFHKNDSSDKAVNEAKKLLIDTGAKEKVESNIIELQQKSLHLLNKLHVSDDARAAFEQLINDCLTRTA